jgi:hypothetical protein
VVQIRGPTYTLRFREWRTNSKTSIGAQLSISATLISEILRDAHDARGGGGHAGVERTLATGITTLYFEGSPMTNLVVIV